jgi:hypothetical protein
MSFNRRKVMEVEKEGTVKFDDGSVLNFVYYPNKNTPNFSYDLDIAKEKGEVKNFIVGWMTRLLKSWDVVDEAPQINAQNEVMNGPDGKPVMVEVPVPITADSIGDMSNSVLDALFSAMIDGMKADPQNGTPSRGSFV